MSKKALNIIFLGGVGEIGKNMTALEYNNNIIVIDSGLAFPDTEMPGVDYVIPDFTYLTNNKDKIKGIVLTHGHEDHIGALPYLLKTINAPVYGSNLTLALVEHRLNEHKMTGIPLNETKDGDVINIGGFNVEFVQVNHSIAGAFALSVGTPKGVIFFTGDFKIDLSPIDGRRIALARIAEIGKKGVLLLLQDSTNAEREGYSMSEMSVGKSLDNIFAQNLSKRIIVATFASNIHRVQQIINCALKYGRRIAFSGRSMENIAKIAQKIKELTFPADKIIDISKIGSVPYDKLCIISTGTQGEPDSALTRMSQNDFKKIVIDEKDTVVISASPIPGNEKPIYTVINNLYKRGADVVYKDLADVHVSGHACQEELKMMFALLKPKYFIPVHGEYRHLKRHVEIAERMGVFPANTLIPELGDCIEVSRAGLKRRTPVTAGAILLDGSIFENAEEFMRDRKHLAEYGFVIAIMTGLPSAEGISPPIIITRGVNVPEAVMDEIKDAVAQRFNISDWGDITSADARAMLRKTVAKVIFQKLKQRPMVIPIVVENR
ncbi:MAG: ribonuclease J [Clostridia bacterium]